MNYLEVKQQKPAVYLILPCNVHQAYIDISVSRLNNENGLSILFIKIKSLYPKGIHYLAYTTHDKFQTCHHPVEMSIVDYLNEFEQLYNK